jgi:hypothetical protein
MNAAVMTSSSASVPLFSGTKAASQTGLSVREWIGAFSSALAMANAVPETGRVSAKQTARVCAIAEAI